MKEDQKGPGPKDKPSTSQERSKFQISDRRFWVLDETAEEQAEVSSPRYPSYIEELKRRTEAAENRVRERIEELEQENETYRNRIDRQLEKRLEQEKVRFLQDFLEILDNFERALDAVDENSTVEHLAEGLRLNLDLLQRRLVAAGVEQIETLKQPFDPNVAEAIGMVPVEDPELDQVVVSVVQEGYRLGDHIIRPARVQVGQYHRSDQG